MYPNVVSPPLTQFWVIFDILKHNEGHNLEALSDSHLQTADNPCVQQD